MRTEPQETLKKFNYLYKELDSIFHTMALKAGLSDSVFYILYTLVYNRACSQKDIAEYYSVSRQTIHSAVKKLETQGYILLTPGPNRNKYLQLTPTGQKLIEDRLTPILKKEKEVFQEMPSQECHELLRLTGKLVALYKEKFS